MPDIIQQIRDTYATDKAAALNMLPELFKQYNEGLIKVLPCKIGDTVWFDDCKHYKNPEGEIRPVEIENITIDTPYWKFNDGDEEFLPSDFGKTIFLTAEAALQERET